MSLSMSHPHSGADPEASARLLAACKADVWRLLQGLPGSAMGPSLREQVAPDATWHVSHPLNELQGPQAVAEQFYGPLQAAFPDLERRIDLFFGGHWTSPPEGEIGYSPPHARAQGWWTFWCQGPHPMTASCWARPTPLWVLRACAGPSP
jgi:hypothetical protein